MRRTGGIFFFIIGVILLFVAMGLNDLLVSPVILIFASFLCWRFYYRKIAIFLLVIGGLALIDVNLWALLFSFALFYASYKLLWTKKEKKTGNEIDSNKEDHNLHWEENFTKYDQAFYRKFRLGDMQYELFDLHATNEVQSIYLDLSRAIIPEGETSIILNGVAGRVYLYLPADLDVTISSSVVLGECEILGKKKMGLHNPFQVTTEKYTEANRKVKISISFLLANVQVRYL
ncbi:cell wall-active antibiotics response protein LiaF [Shimazuella sp. AN120528]|uniref:cell wall-active antibiotics response protein LiaF n=1 Tax=Shimazuella soli TaxID=1892854 RepID=UPI001F0D77D9|nr:cell wall-active antibiotics response protein LiaF [Shimazuella soli]MCH5585013.1 cell wall-active antibiotics response protein LiaF [Shimazuella soli]